MMTHIPPIRSDYEHETPGAFNALAKLTDPTESWPSWRALIEIESRSMRVPFEQALSAARAASALWGIEAAADCLELWNQPLAGSPPKSSELASPSEWAAIAVHCAIFGRDRDYAPNPAIRALFSTPQISLCIAKCLATRIRDLEDNSANDATLRALGAIEITWGIGRFRLLEPFSAFLKERFMFYDARRIERLLDQAKDHTQSALSVYESKSISQSIPSDELAILRPGSQKTL